ncbi:MAG TPA: hypothetical protein VE954_22270 [Oligoflexus sp.]|uniref:hypothetical protein n=1 Tax=Oligoflexus sp. TaxID=1971216 RepID=UPI002D60AAC5|nr:hypothetical protein [Oligoflexus sp.]HYX35834.1 hypothetical protein [Oligoflexus sp.]
MMSSVASSRRFIVSVLLAAVPLTGCNFKDVKDSSEDTAVTVDPSVPVSFAEIQTKILQPSCLGCHSSSAGNSGGVNLETYAVVKAQAAAIKSSTVDSKRMPKGDTLSANSVALLKAWIEQGTPE